MNKRITKAFFFDYDGVLIQSVVNPLAWALVGARYDAEMDPRVFFENEGNVAYVAGALINTYNLKDVSPKKLVDEKKDIAKVLMKWGITDKPHRGIKQILTYLKTQGIRTGIVTGTHKDIVERNIPLLYALFDFVIAADDTVHGREIRGKPDPEQYEVAVSRAKKICGVQREQCTVIENSPLGIRAAKDARLFCIALMTTLDKKTLVSAGADIVLESHDSLSRYMQRTIQ